MIAWILLGLAALSLLLVIYWLTEKPTPEQLRKSRVVDVAPKFSGQVQLRPPEVIGTLDLRVKDVMTRGTTVGLPYIPPDEKWEKLLGSDTHNGVRTEVHGHVDDAGVVHVTSEHYHSEKK